MPEYQAMTQMIVANGQVIPRVAYVPGSGFRKREGFTTPLTDSERSVPPFGASIYPLFLEHAWGSKSPPTQAISSLGHLQGKRSEEME